MCIKVHIWNANQINSDAGGLNQETQGSRAGNDMGTQGGGPKLNVDTEQG